MPLLDLQANYDALHRELTGQPSRYGVPDAAPDVNDEIPTFDFPGDKPMPSASEEPKATAEGGNKKPRVRVPAATSTPVAAE